MTLLPYLCVCGPTPIVAVCTKKLAVTCDQEAYHSCFLDLISKAWAKLPLGRQFSFFLIGALIRSEKHIVCAHIKADTAEASSSACKYEEEENNTTFKKVV